MARIVRDLVVDRPATEVFDAIADFTRTREWDPGVDGARPLDEPAVGPGARFQVRLASFGRFRPEFVYETATYARPRRVVLTTRTAWAEGVDEVDVREEGGRTVVRWEADFHLRGPARVLDPLLAIGLRRVGDAAVSGLTRWLTQGGSAVYQAV